MPEDGASFRFYRWLLRLYPAGFRENYAASMERQFLDELSDSRGRFALTILWIRIFRDLSISVPVQAAREVMQDSRHALRLWRRRALHTGFAIAALAIGIGANTGVFSVVNALLLRSLPFHDPDHLITIHIFVPPSGSAKEFHDWRQQSTYLEDAALIQHGDANLGGTRESARVHMAETSWNFFSMLGVQPVLGRAFFRDEDIPGKNAVAVISYGLWQQLFAGSRSALGATIRANGTPVTVIGVAPPGMDYPSKTVLWTPSAFARDFIPHTAFLAEFIGRLKPGITRAQAGEAFMVEANRQSAKHSKANRAKYPPRMIRLRDEIAGPVKTASLILMAGVVLILLIACSNVANLLMARTADRATELSIRSALGASRARLSQQLLTESVLLSLVASAAGLLVAHGTILLVDQVQPAPLSSQAYSILDSRVLLFCVGISVLSALLFGIVPSLYAGRVHNFGTRSSSAMSSGSRRIREALVAAQVMLTIVLLAGSVSLGRGFFNLMDAERGFDTRGLITASISLDGTTHQSDQRQLPYFNQALARVRQLPGVRQASATGFLPLDATVFLGAPYTMDGAAPKDFRDFAMLVPVLPHYFETMGDGILHGREFTDQEVSSDAAVAVVSEQFANEFGTAREAIGHQLRLGNLPPKKIIGVVKGMDYMADANPVEIFLPARSPGGYFPSVVVRVDGDAKDHLSMVRDAIRSVDPQVPLFGVKTMEQRLDDALARPKFYSTALIFFAAFAVLLAVMGIYGAVSYAVTQRTHEMGVRLALGTTAGRLRSVLLGQGLATVAVGAVPGVAGALLSGRYLESLIAGVRSVSVSTCVVSVMFIAAIAAAGVWGATRRITRLDIMGTLRAN